MQVAFPFLVEDLFYQHRDGLIDDERHAGTENVLRLRLQSPGLRAAWSVLKAQFGPDFRAYVDNLMRETKPVPNSDLGTAWKDALAAQPIASSV